MQKNIYIIRHCKAEGQFPDAALTEAGQKQAEELADFLSGLQVDRVISSPFLRARHTIAPYAERTGKEVEIDSRLAERHLEPDLATDWLAWMKASFTDMDLRDAGGESGGEATNRIADVIHDIVESDVEHTAIVTHGGMITLLLHQYDEQIGFDQWQGLSNPDVFELNVSDGRVSFRRLWTE